MSRLSIRRPTKAQPELEGLEGRQLLSVSASAVSSGTDQPVPARVTDLKHGISLNDRRMSYVTPQGTHVTITLYGVGTLAGTSFGPNKELELVYDKTNADTGIIAKVSGGNGRAPLASIKNAKLGLDNFSGVGSSVINVMNLKNFDLVDGGQINMTGGVNQLYLNSVGSNTQIHLRQLPSTFNTPSASSSSSSSTTSTNSKTFTATENGVSLTYKDDSLGARTLTAVSGTAQSVKYSAVAPTPSSTSTSSTGVDPGPPPAPPGILLKIGKVQGNTSATKDLQDPQVYGYDPMANALIRFDASTGEALQTISLQGMGTMTTGVALGRNNHQLVVLIGNGTTVFAFNALSGVPVGSFTTTNLPNFASVDGIGSTDDRTVLMDSPAGLAQIIDLTKSLAEGAAHTIGGPFTPLPEFAFSGGLTGVAGQETVYGTGAAFFNSFLPTVTQAGIISMDVSGNSPKETDKTALMSKGDFINTGPSGTVQSMPFQALGSIDQNLALVTGVSNGKNVVTLYNPFTLSSPKKSTITLNDANKLTGLSESFRPDLVDSALIDIQGSLQSFRATSAHGLVMNVAGLSNLVKIQRTSDSTFIALPFAHAQMPHRSNVTILSSSRAVDGRNKVTVDSSQAAVGPLSLPTPSSQD